MNLDYLIDEIMHDVTPLDWQAVINSDLPLKVGADASRQLLVAGSSSQILPSLFDMLAVTHSR